MMKCVWIIPLLGVLLYLGNVHFEDNLYWIPSSQVYSSSTLDAPVLAGDFGEIFYRVGRIWPLSEVIFGKVYADSNFDVVAQFATTLKDVMGVSYPLVLPSVEEVEFSKKGQEETDIEGLKGAKVLGHKFLSISDYAEAYRSDAVTPLSVAQKYIENVKSDTVLNAFLPLDEENILEQARLSTQRFKEGKPISILDGILVTAKDEINVDGYRQYCGTKFLDLKSEESTMIKRLRAAGAIIAGKNTMHEVGMGITGHNPHFGVARNPYNISHHTGGSSSGSAAAVASGLVPVALGCDGGGSIRIPSGNCGIYGLKTTAGRIPGGTCPLTLTVGQCGPMTATAKDAAIVYQVIAGADEKDTSTVFQPPVHLSNFGESLSGLKVGIFMPYIRDSTDEIFQAINTSLAVLEAKGAKLIDIEIPNLEPMQKAHTITISTEMNTLLSPYLKDHLMDFGLDVRMTMELTSRVKASDYIAAQKVKSYGIDLFQKIFQDVDVILLPNSGILAPQINPAVNHEGSQPELNSKSLSEVLRFAALPNFLGFPSMALPIAYNPDNLPIAIQFMAPWWKEHTILNIANELEKVTHRSKPEIFYSNL
eukprot:TRINITY_DN3015_c0_g1_i1.p1 TRINITY_DN3015_c0_g1~~TRINITY_DN3015_c0_g1_i1.p1  ORF type:complete len:592 (-),score=131.95 TRINITY_DN3015_c0_g1_i1:36-1811(-)